MKHFLQINFNENELKYLQIKNAIIRFIQNGELKKGDRIPSINDMSNEYLLARATVEKAYRMLRQTGIILSRKGKGYYINRVNVTVPLRILLIFNKISYYKKLVYDSFIKAIGADASVDLQIHHNNLKVFDSIISNSLDSYDYYIVMPHFYEQQDEVIRIIKSIPRQKLLLLDKKIEIDRTSCPCIYQDFENDLVDTLNDGVDLLGKYNKLVLVFSEMVPYPKEIITGFKHFCTQHNFKYEIISEINFQRKINKGEAYIVIEETDLVNIIRICQDKKMKIGKEIGILSYNETPLKQILLNGITVISTNHTLMGETAAKFILEKRKDRIKNPFALVRRNSL